MYNSSSHSSHGQLPTPNPATLNIGGVPYAYLAFYYPGQDTDWDTFFGVPYFGNFWESPVTVTFQGITASFHTSEAAFQATKWWNDPTIRKKFENAKTGDDAFRLRNRLGDPTSHYAGLGRDKAMYEILMQKFQDPGLKAALLSTGDAYLLEHNSKPGRDDYWSDDHCGGGKNKLGITLMEVRQAFGGQGMPPALAGKVDDFTQAVIAQFGSKCHN